MSSAAACAESSSKEDEARSDCESSGRDDADGSLSGTDSALGLLKADVELRNDERSNKEKERLARSLSVTFASAGSGESGVGAFAALGWIAAATVVASEETCSDSAETCDRIKSVDERLEFIAVRNWVPRSDRFSDKEDTLDCRSLAGFVGNEGTVGAAGVTLAVVAGTVGAEVGRDEIGIPDAAEAARVIGTGMDEDI